MHVDRVVRRLAQWAQRRVRSAGIPHRAVEGSATPTVLGVRAIGGRSAEVLDRFGEHGRR
jgi:hypothetical protein